MGFGGVTVVGPMKKSTPASANASSYILRMVGAPARACGSPESLLVTFRPRLMALNCTDPVLYGTSSQAVSKSCRYLTKRKLSFMSDSSTWLPLLLPCFFAHTQ